MRGSRRQPELVPNQVGVSDAPHGVAKSGPDSQSTGLLLHSQTAQLTGIVKVSSTDRASNTATREFSLSNLTSASADAGYSIKTTNNQAAPDVNRLVPQQQLISSPAIGGAADTSNSGQISIINPSVPQEQTKSVVLQEQIKPVVSQEQIKPSVTPTPGTLPFKAADTAVLHTETKAQVSPAVADTCQPSKQAGGKWLMISQPRVSLDYKIEEEGKSGVGKVEVWITRDNGYKWDVFCEDPDKKSPAVFELPGEGHYGIRLSITNGRGFDAIRPRQAMLRTWLSSWTPPSRRENSSP